MDANAPRSIEEYALQLARLLDEIKKEGFSSPLLFFRYPSGYASAVAQNETDRQVLLERIAALDGEPMGVVALRTDGSPCCFPVLQAIKKRAKSAVAVESKPDGSTRCSLPSEAEATEGAMSAIVAFLSNAYCAYASYRHSMN